MKTKLVVASVLLVSNIFNAAFLFPEIANAKKGCNPKYDPLGCAGKGAPTHLVKTRQFEILAIGCNESKGSCGYASKNLRVGDTTSLILNKPSEGFKRVTYSEVSFY